MLACARVGAIHSVVFGGFSSESLRDRINDSACAMLITADGGYRRGQMLPLKQMADEALKDTPVDQERRSSCKRDPGSAFPVHVQEGRDHWYHRLMQDASPVCRARADGQRGHAVHPLHVRHHREAEGHRAHDRRLHGRHLRLLQARVRPQGHRRLLVHGRHRLGDGPQLRRLRAAGRRRDGVHLRGRAGLAGEGPVLEPRRTPRRHRVLHGAHGHPRVHALGHRLAGEARSVVAAAAGIGGRADQPGGLGLVPPEHREASAARSSTRGGRPRPARSSSRRCRAS